MKKFLIILSVVAISSFACFAQNANSNHEMLISESNCPTTEAIYRTSDKIYAPETIAAHKKALKRFGLVCPPYLQKGDSVGVVTVSSPVTHSRGKADSLIAIMESWGLKVKLGKNLFKRECGAFSVSDKERGEELQEMIDNENIKAIIFYRGGYGAIRTVDYVDLTPLKKHPKWVMGFSDLTTYLSLLNNMGIESIHGGMVSSISRSDPENDIDTKTMRATLFGELESLNVEPNDYNQYGEVEGVLVGGNMSLMSIAYGTPYDLEVDKNSILFIEEVDEKMSAIDRFMQQLSKSGKLSQIKGMVIGTFVRPTDDYDWGISIYDLIKSYTKDLNIPVLYGIRSGHGKYNHSLYMGGPVILKVTPEGGSITFE